MVPDAWQAEVLRSDAPRVLLNCSRQSGKSVTAATKCGARRRVRAGRADSAPEPLSAAVRRAVPQGDGRLQDARSPRAGRRGVGDHTESRERHRALCPCRAPRAPCDPTRPCACSSSTKPPACPMTRTRRCAPCWPSPVASSSPCPRRSARADGGSRHGSTAARRGSATACPLPSARASPRDSSPKRRRRSASGAFKQEYECDFMEAQTQAFAAEAIEALFSEDVETWDL